MAILTRNNITFDDLDLVWRDDAPPPNDAISEEVFDRIYGEHEEYREHGSTECTYDFDDNQLTII